MAKGKKMKVRRIKEKKKGSGIPFLVCAIAVVLFVMIGVVFYIRHEIKLSYYPKVLEEKADGLLLPSSDIYSLDSLENIAQNLYDGSGGNYEIFPCDGQTTYRENDAIMAKVIPSLGDECSFVFIEKSTGNLDMDIEDNAASYCTMLGETEASFKVVKEGEGLIDGARAVYKSGVLSLEGVLVSKKLYVSACCVYLSNAESVSFVFVTERLQILKSSGDFLKAFVASAVIKGDTLEEETGLDENYESTSPFLVEDKESDEVLNEDELDVSTYIEYVPKSKVTDDSVSANAVATDEE